MHGANWVALKTEGEIRVRAARVVSIGWYALVLVTILELSGRDGRSATESWITIYVLPIGWLIPVIVVVSLAAIKFFSGKGNDKFAFISSSIYLAMMLGGAVFGLYPKILPALDPAFDLTIQNAKAGSYGLGVGLIWWSIGIIIALGYFAFLFRTFKGKVEMDDVH